MLKYKKKAAHLSQSWVLPHSLAVLLQATILLALTRIVRLSQQLSRLPSSDQIVATDVACAQLWSDCGNSCRVCPALIRLWQQLSRLPSSDQMYFSLQHFIFEGIKAGDFIHVLGQKCVCIINCKLQEGKTELHVVKVKASLYILYNAG